MANDKHVRFEDAAGFLGSATTFVIRTRGLTDAARAFERNVDRLQLYARMPTSLMGLAGHFQAAHTEAVRELSAEDINGNLTITPEFTAKVSSALEREGPFSDDDLLARYRRICGPLAAADGCFIYDSFLVFCAAQTILAWTTFETLAGDLWKAAVNERTNTLGKAMVEQKSGKSLPIWLLGLNDWDLRGKLGTIAATNFRFSRLEDIQEAYGLAFGQDSAIAKTCTNPMLRALVLTRNVLAHKGGIADAIFLKGIAETGTGLFQDLKPNDEVAVSAKQASDFADMAMSTGATLMLYVDSWIQSHPE